jgi:hypothetical protein
LGFLESYSQLKVRQAFMKGYCNKYIWWRRKRFGYKDCKHCQNSRNCFKLSSVSRHTGVWAYTFTTIVAESRLLHTFENPIKFLIRNETGNVSFTNVATGKKIWQRNFISDLPQDMNVSWSSYMGQEHVHHYVQTAKSEKTLFICWVLILEVIPVTSTNMLGSVASSREHSATKTK